MSGEVGHHDARERAQAICGAYLSVAFADARFDETEKNRFLGGLINEPGFSDIPGDTLTSVYNEFVAALGADYAAAMATIVSALAAIRHDAPLRDCAVKAARIAIVADDALTPQEDAVLHRIEEALGLEKNTI